MWTKWDQQEPVWLFCKRRSPVWRSQPLVAYKEKTPNKENQCKEDRSLFARMMMVCKSRPEIDIKETVGQYEFLVVPRSSFAADIMMLHCSSKNICREAEWQQKQQESSWSKWRSSASRNCRWDGRSSVTWQPRVDQKLRTAGWTVQQPCCADVQWNLQLIKCV